MRTDGYGKPFIKKFCDGGYFYVYDVNTNQVVEVEKSVYDIIEEYEDYKNQRIVPIDDDASKSMEKNQSLEKIKKAKRELGLFSNFKPVKVTLGIQTAEGVKELHSSGLKQIILEITRDCSLNCAYCATSGKYASPVPFQNLMSRETCKKSVDFFCENAFNSHRPVITFYGGEPLLRFDLIRETVEYVKNEYVNKKYNFNLTTNGTILNKVILDFFIENDFSILVSLDGPEKINDRYRRFKNGRGTFKRIMNNLEFLKAYDKDYYSRRVSISSVLSPPFDKVDEILDFFANDKTLENIKGSIGSNFVDTRGTSFIEDFDLEESMKELPNVSNKLMDRLKNAILSNNIQNLTIEKKRVFSILYNLSKRVVKRIHDYTHPLGTCHIGLKRIFVKTNGDFYVCERSGGDYKIGSIDEGFDYERIATYYRKLEEILADCRSCWAMNHCERCWVMIGNIEEFKGNKKEEFCAVNKKIIEDSFKLYTQLLREDPDCLKVFKDVVIA